MCQRLINAGGAVTENGLMCAAQKGRLEVCKLLITSGALLERITYWSLGVCPSVQLNPLLIAAYKGNAKVSSYLVSCEADIYVSVAGQP